MITIDNVSKSYGAHQVINNINLSIKDNGILAVLGPNGSGKTTLLKCLLGMVIFDSGDILFKGKSIKGDILYRAEIGYLSQIAQFPENLTGWELIKFMKKLKPGETREEEIIALFQLENELGKKMSHLSGGTRQKVNIILALMHDDPVIILDEPSTGLDPLSLKKLKIFIRKEKAENKLILITTHIMSLAEELADQILFLLDGNIHFNGSLVELYHSTEEKSLEDAIAHFLKNKEKKTDA